MNNSPCLDCPERESCDKAKCWKYQTYLAREAKQNADKAWFQELSKQLKEPMDKQFPKGKPFQWKGGKAMKFVPTVVFDFDGDTASLAEKVRTFKPWTEGQK